MVGANDDLSQQDAGTPGHRLRVRDITHAFEDLPGDVRAQAAEISREPSNLSLRHRVVDELENAAFDSYGNLERVPLLHLLSHYPVTPYTYTIADVLVRGERPTPQKLQDLYRRQNIRATVNLCAEIADGDQFLLGQAGLTSAVRTTHIPIVDMQPPTPTQVVQLLDLLSGPGAQRTYVHCEAGKCRTGVMTACYRMAIMGWDEADAYTEAKNFGCSVPMQRAFIQQFGALLLAQYQARADGKPAPDPMLGRYPLQPPGSVKATAAELIATIASVASHETGGPVHVEAGGLTGVEAGGRASQEAGGAAGVV